VLTLDVEGTEALALPKQIEIHPIRRNIQHVDLIVVRRGEKVTVEVNVVVEGDAAPGTLVTQETNSIEIESDAMSIPEQLTLSIEGTRAGTQITAAQVPLPDGTTLVSDPELLVVNVIVAPSEEELEAEGGGPSLEEQAEEAEAEAEGDEDGEASSDSESDSDS
jgi:large subunit ribosomal protein L25